MISFSHVHQRFSKDLDFDCERCTNLSRTRLLRSIIVPGKFLNVWFSNHPEMF